MFDFLLIECTVKNGKAEIRPDFDTYHHDDLLIRGRDFYAAWIEERGVWSTNEKDVIEIVDRELWNYANEHKNEWMSFTVHEMSKSSSRMLARWHKYCKEDLRDTIPTASLDRYLTFQNTKVTKKDYVSKRLPYALEPGDFSAYDILMSRLYEPEERKKIEWAIGSVVAGQSENIQKFIVIYGDPGKGKSTVLDIIEKMFPGYCGAFDAETLGSSTDNFSMEPFKDNLLLMFDHEAKLDRLETNKKLNKIVSHDIMPMNTKNHPIFMMKIRSMLFMAANDPVKITNAKSGLLRRMIDVYPSGKTFPEKEYFQLKNKINFEYSGIAWHCKQVYESNPNAYNSYKPMQMLEATNDFYNFMLYNYMIFDEQDGISLKDAWELYKAYCEMANAPKMNYRVFRTELNNYFNVLYDRAPANVNQNRPCNYYAGLKREKFVKGTKTEWKQVNEKGWIFLKEQPSIFDKIAENYPAQYGDDSKTPPISAWSRVTTKLKDIDTSKLHYVRVPINHIVLDFDIRDESGEKNLELNLKEANKWPKTYAETSKSGQGIHLHYIYKGDPMLLSRNIGEKVEVKVFNGLSSLRRKLSLCNDIPIQEISSGLPMKEERKMVNEKVIKDSKHLEATIKKWLRRVELTKSGQAEPDDILHTKQCISLIDKVLNDAYDNGIEYDLTRLRGQVLWCAMGSSNNQDFCVTKVANMKFSSDDITPGEYNKNMSIVIFDVEVMKNLFVIVYKLLNHDGVYEPCLSMINPARKDVIDILRYGLVGYNCRRYDNHILYAWAYLGYSNYQLYQLSQSIVTRGEGFNMEARDLSLTDIYDFASKKQSLKKWEIELWKKYYGTEKAKLIKHKELGIDWDEEVPKERWNEVVSYCKNDVIATELLFEELQPDFTARKILAKLSGGTLNDSTNKLTALWIFGNDRNPQKDFNYRNLALPVGSDQYEEYKNKFGADWKFRVFNAEGLPEFREYHGEDLPEGWSILPFFPGYSYEAGVSNFMGEKIGEGGRVYAEPGIWYNVWDGDSLSMHPHSAYAEWIFGPVYTKRFYDLVEIRAAIKHKNYDFVKNYKDGILAEFVSDEKSAKELSYALKIAINAVYGQTSAKYDNPFLDIRNKDNIVAKRGALFMTVLKDQVQKRGFTVCHIKTDSIKIPNATPEIKKFVEDFGKEYGYTFEVEEEFEKFCLVNDAVYVGKTKDGNWTATGTQFKVPYVFKTLFSREPVIFTDLCETKEVQSARAMYLDMNEDLPEGEHDYKFIGKVGLFCPIKPGCRGGQLVKQVKNKDGSVKYDAVTGCKGYRWLEAETVEELSKQDDIDFSYYNRLVDEAVRTIEKFGDPDIFRE